ncbi:hypothetical protein FA95DRAFT_1221995 [Auriscalpium vulgare]|uniref:Uncharacterized protein n=1 Tax=Auriscalpium vulgare TaxID=40419 RepID=A0ACB8RU94_9AGAM|nr:hypothetical protein FA95DRAFT_1221995 [Auriscalpium vulgare]
MLSGVHTLRLTLLSDTDLEGAVLQYPIVEFFCDTLPPLLAAPAATVTTLELRADQAVGGIPGLLPALGELRCPSLQRLALRHVLFAGVTVAEAFVLAHADTLTSLRLENCKVSIGPDEDSPDRLWAQIYGALAEGLVCLRELDVEEDHEGAIVCFFSVDVDLPRYAYTHACTPARLGAGIQTQGSVARRRG